MLFFFFGAYRVEAQTQTATISGTATDPSGGALVGAKVQVTNVGTNAAQTTVTDGQGRYEVPDLPIGTYDIQASLAGFQTVTHKGVTLTVGAHPLVDFALPVGEATQNVTVEGQVSQVEPQSATVSSLVSQTQLEQLPLNDATIRSFLNWLQGFKHSATAREAAPAREAEVHLVPSMAIKRVIRSLDPGPRVRRFC
jgi:hypothetical protein